MFIRNFVLFVCIIHLISGYDDIDFKCDKETKRIGMIRSKTTDGKRNFKFLCQDLLESEKIQSPECYLGKPLKCDDKREGCGDNEWLNGFQVLDVGAAVGMLVPLCCKSKNVQISDCDKPEAVNPNGGFFLYRITQNKIAVTNSCTLELDSTKKIKDMHLKMSQCLYKIDGATPKFSNPESKPVTSRS